MRPVSLLQARYVLPAFVLYRLYVNHPLEDIQELISKCLNNDRVGQEKLYRRFYPALFLLCRKFFTDENDALEALNDGMLRVFKYIKQYDESKGQFFNWVYTIVRNAALDKLKNNNTYASVEVTDLVIAGNDNPLEALEWKDIYTLLHVLPPGTRAVCVLYYIEGLAINEICRQLQLSAGTVKWHLSETRSKLKPVLLRYHSK
ncbi:RNA polymerase sigma-70 factor, ECF subfamily [Chitinophaga sp. CF118]|uniref:RNA polymerase sigma factor n=1 Tax=Chitinophaga sp. CF118 TaxID=1884367 RepID=UPI0008F13280|nr:sigma-70 family RNA polymerase sigma factor [Chitinophaga sp. CF118]SFE04269.1 RNA polymerase sigma-70 factor, ECF subfamily [Chitinophaga sp. CF118]